MTYSHHILIIIQFKKCELGEHPLDVLICFGHWMLWNWIGQLLDSCIREIRRFQIADIRR